MSVQNLIIKDPFAADLDDDKDASSTAVSGGPASLAAGKTENAIHIRIQQRNGRKTLTTIQGLPTEYDPKKVLKAAKKEFACNGSMVEDSEYGSVIQLQGDQRIKIQDLLVSEGVDKDNIKLHGF